MKFTDTYYLHIYKKNVKFQKGSECFESVASNNIIQL